MHTGSGFYHGHALYYRYIKDGQNGWGAIPPYKLRLGLQVQCCLFPENFNTAQQNQVSLPTENDLLDYQSPKPQKRRGKSGKDKERRARNVSGKSEKYKPRKVKSKFDSTLGYPGEGPAGGRGSSHARQRCRICRGNHSVGRCPAHPRNILRNGGGDSECKHADDCKGSEVCGSGCTPPTACVHIPNCHCTTWRVRPTVPVLPNSPRPLADRQPADHGHTPSVIGGQPNPFNPDDHGPAEVKEAEAGLPNDPARDSLDMILSDIRSKCRMMLDTRDLGSAADRDVVKRSMWAIARKSSLHSKTVESESVIINRIYREVHQEVLTVRLDTSSAMLHDYRTYNTRQLVQAAWGFRPIGSVALSHSMNPLVGLTLYENLQPYSIIDSKKLRWWQNLLVFLIYMLKTICGPAVEETFKRVMSNLLYYVFPLMFRRTTVTWLRMARIAPALLIAIFEVRKRKASLKVILIFALRSFGHSVLAYLDLGVAIVFHALWNWAMDYLDTTWKLSVFEDDLTKESNVIADVCCDDHYFKPVKLQSEYKVNEGDPECHPKFGVRIMWGVRNCIPTVYRSCIHNERVSMEGRVGKSLPQHESGQPSRVLRNWKMLQRTIIPFLLLRVAVAKPMNMKKWLSTFIPKRRDELLRLWCLGFSEYDRVASAFIKRETALKTRDEYVFKDPRFIQGCPPEMTLECGRYIRTAAKSFREGMRPHDFEPCEVRAGQHIIYTCGLSNDLIGGAFAKSINCITSMCDPGERVVFLEDDQSRFDMHLTEGAFGFLSDYYKKRLPRRVRRALKRGLSRGRTNNGTRYSVPFTMQSGWPDTSFGDTLVNAAMKLHIHGAGRKWISIICGDDSVTITTDRELARVLDNGSIVEQYAAFGMEVEAHIRYQEEDVEFCSARFMRNRETCVLVPKVGKMLGKLCSDMVDRNPGNQKAWLRGICETLNHYGQMDPLLGSLGNALKRDLGSGKVIRDVLGEYKHKYGKPLDVNVADLQYYYAHHYDVSCSNIETMKSHLSKTTVGQITCDPLLVALAQRDAN